MTNCELLILAILIGLALPISIICVVVAVSDIVEHGF